jgi:hypothetical protein
MSAKRRAVYRRFAGAAVPGGVPAAVPEAGNVPDEDLPGAELVAVGAAIRRVSGLGNPLPAHRFAFVRPHREPPAAGISRAVKFLAIACGLPENVLRVNFYFQKRALPT